MNPIEFCRLRGYHSTIFFTYSFDPLFFERIVLPEVRASQKGNIAVVADQSQLTQAQDSWSGQLVGLGTRYQLHGFSSKASFHPKLIIRFSSDAGAVWTGSANLTFGGWNVNRELAAAWKFGGNRTDNGSWIGPVIKSLNSQGITSENSVLLARILRERWLQDLLQAPEDLNSTLVTNFDGQALGTKLEKRWRGRRFSNVKVTTGSTDRRGAWLRRLHDLFGVTTASVLTEGGRCSFEADELSKLPLDVSVSSPFSEQPRPMHAKFYWFEGPDGPAAVFGSANCSAAAWLNGPGNGGNHESLVIYDNPHEADFADILRLFDEEVDAVDLEIDGSSEQKDPPPSMNKFRVVSASWEAGAPLVIRFGSTIEKPVTVTARVADKMLQLLSDDPDGNVWIAKEAFDWPRAETPFAEIAIVNSQGETRIQRVWIDSYEKLRESEEGDDFKNAFAAMQSAPPSDKQKTILNRLHKISSAILMDTDQYSDPKIMNLGLESGKPENEQAKDAKPLDPANLIRSLSDIDVATGRGKLENHKHPQISLFGVMRALYEDGRRNLLDEENDRDDSPGNQSPGDTKNNSRKKKKKLGRHKDARAQDKHLIDAKYQERLRKQTAQFLEKLASSEFSQATSAMQLMQAAAYPIALAVFSVRDGWANEEAAQEWCRQAFDTLFRRQYPGDKFGLIEFVAARYDEQGESHIFRLILGDGTLWFALLAAVNEFPWQGPNEWIEKAFVLRDIFRSDNLAATAKPDRLRSLFGKAQQIGLEEALNLAPQVDALLNKLETHLSENFVRLTTQQQSLENRFSNADLMWRHNAGWGVFTGHRPPKPGFLMMYLHRRAAETPVMSGFFVNVSQASQCDPIIAKLLLELEKTCAKPT